jgi:hypothetical protein
MQPGTFDRLLPLPTFHHDAAKNTTEVQAEDQQRYVRQMFFPLASNVVGDLSGFLDQIAATARAGIKE